MKSILIITLTLILLSSCANEQNRYNTLKKLYPNSKVEPSTGIIKNSGYDWIIIDSTMQIVAVSFYPFSETKISNFRNIR